jgi:SNF family Na+-dependent transporter
MVPYLTFVLLVGIPTMLLEFSMGQFMSLGGINVWNIMPIAKGSFIQNHDKSRILHMRYKFK